MIWIKDRLRELKKTQRALGQAAGLSEVTVSDIILKRRQINLREIEKFAKFLKMAPEEVFNRVVGARVMGRPGPGIEEIDADLLARLLDEVRTEMAARGMDITDSLVAGHVAQIYATGMRALRGKPWNDQVISIAVLYALEGEMSGDGGSVRSRNPDAAPAGAG